MTAITRAAFWMALILTGNGLNLVRASGPATEPNPAK